MDLLFVLAVTISSLVMIILGGWITRRAVAGGLRFGKANRTTFSRKLFGFVLFIVALFLIGALSERLQTAVYDYLQQNVATSATGIAITIVIAWILYDWLIWRKHNQ